MYVYFYDGALIVVAFHLEIFPFWHCHSSQKDLENLKAEVQRRQQLQEAIKGADHQEADNKDTEVTEESKVSTATAETIQTQSSA